MKNVAVIRTNKTTELRFKRSPSVTRKAESPSQEQNYHFVDSSKTHAPHSSNILW